MSRSSRAALAALSVLAVSAASLAAAPAAHADDEAPAFTVVASGLDNPRQLSVGPGQRLYVAEAGRGGDGPCVTGAEGVVCFGLTGAVTEVRGSTQSRVVTGLPSLGAQGSGDQATGPADVDVRGNTIAIVMGLGGTTETRTAAGEAAATLGTVLTGRLGSPLSVAADLAAFEETDPDGDGVDSNPTGFIARDSRNWAVVDAGGNSLVTAGKDGSHLLATFPKDRSAPVPFPGPWGPPGTPIAYQSVPTDVAKGPDGAYYVSELTGLPFPAGEARIYRVVPGQAPTVYATGLTNVTSLEWKGGTLYAVQLADNGLLQGPIGSLRRVVPNGTEHPAVVSGLFAPYGLAIRGNDAYVTTGSVAVGAGQVIRVSLR